MDTLSLIVVLGGIAGAIVSFASASFAGVFRRKKDVRITLPDGEVVTIDKNMDRQDRYNLSEILKRDIQNFGKKNDHSYTDTQHKSP